MNFKPIITSFLAAIFLSSPVSAEVVYIDDKIKVWSRTGPTNGYNVKYEFEPGTKLQVLQTNEQTKYIEVQDERGRTAWIESKYTSKSPTVHQMVNTLTNEVSNLKAQLESTEKNLNLRIAQLEPFEQRNKDLQTKITTLQTEFEQVKQKADLYQTGFNTEAMFGGAVVLFGGMILGFIITRLGGGRKKSGWS